MKIRAFVTFSIITLGTFSLAFDSAYREVAEKIGLDLVLGATYTCALETSGVTCWGTDYPLISDFNPNQIAANYSHACAIGGSEIKCWGTSKDGNDYGKSSVGRFQNPKSVSVGREHTCALDDFGVRCWGLNNEDQLSVPTLRGPLQVAAGAYETCALDFTGVHCWGGAFRHKHRSLNLPVNPKQLSVGGRLACALDDSGVRCWGNYPGETRTQVPSLKNPKSVSVGGSHVCVLDEEGVQCWGWGIWGEKHHQLEVPALVNPILVKAGQDHTCALDDYGVKCWGRNGEGQTTVPASLNSNFRLDFSTSSPGAYFEKLSSYFSSPKSSFFKAIAKIAAPLAVTKEMETRVSYNLELSSLALLTWVFPLVEETMSGRVQTFILPQLKTDIEKLKKALHVSLESIPINPTSLNLTLKVSVSALLAVKETISDPSTRADLEVMISDLGRTSLKADEISQIFHNHRTLLDSLIQSEKTLGFGRVLEQIRKSLRGQE